MGKGPERIGDIFRVDGAARLHPHPKCRGLPCGVAGGGRSARAKYSRVGGLKRGKLEVVVVNSALIQEFGFRKAEILRTMNRLLPEQGIKDIRYRLGAIE